MASRSVLTTFLLRFSCAFVAVAVLLFAGTPPAAQAAKKTFEDKKRGFRVRIEDSYVQNPPKLTSDEAHVVAEWYEDSAKFDASLTPRIEFDWFPSAKAGTVTPGSGEKPKTPDPTDPESIRDMFRDQFRIKDTTQAADAFLEGNQHLFGEFTPTADRWPTAAKDKTTGGIQFQYFEVNAPGAKKPAKKKKDKEKPKDPNDPSSWIPDEPLGYALVARFNVDRPDATVEVGFIARCEINHAKKMRAEFFAVLKSFDEIRDATDTLNLGASKELDEDPVKFREGVKKQKLIPGWKYIDTKNYLVLYHQDVDEALARSVGTQIEAIRAQLYETIFPPDRPIKVCSVVRVCKDAEQYHNYGGPGDSAGYWYAPGMELVFYEDQSNKKDSLRVLYHEAFHQYIHYSVGDFSPHSWFNEGHGDFFFGHNYSGGRFTCAEAQWRVSEAKEWKRNPKRPPLKEWLGWTQAQYYGSNAAQVPIGANYALGWNFIYFLRTTKKPEYQGILDRYFKSLKGSVTRARAAREAWEKKMKERRENPPALPEDGSGGESPPPGAGDGSGGDGGGGDGAKPDGGAKPDDDDLPPWATDVGSEDKWLRDALKAAFEGVDMDKLEKDWLND